MIKLMSAELMATIIGTAVTVITLGITIFLTNRSTLKILERLTKVAESTHELQKNMAGVQKDMSKCMFKIAFWGKNTLKALDCDVREGVESREEAEKYGELLDYDQKLKCAFIKNLKKSKKMLNSILANTLLPVCFLKNFST